LYSIPVRFGRGIFVFFFFYNKRLPRHRFRRDLMNGRFIIYNCATKRLYWHVVTVVVVVVVVIYVECVTTNIENVGARTSVRTGPDPASGRPAGSWADFNDSLRRCNCMNAAGRRYCVIAVTSSRA